MSSGTELLQPTPDYEGLIDAMFHTIRQNASGSAFVLIRMLDVLGKVAEVERATDRLANLDRHADLILRAGEGGVESAEALEELGFGIRLFGSPVTASTSRAGSPDQ